MAQVIVSADRTLYNQRTKRYVEFVQEYELIKAKQHPQFTQVQQWAAARKVDKRNFLKYYNRFKQSGGDVTSLLPQKRGPRYKTRRADLELEGQVRALRQSGNNRYEIADVAENLSPKSPLSLWCVQGPAAHGDEPPAPKPAGGKAKDHQRANGTTRSHRYLLLK